MPKRPQLTDPEIRKCIPSEKPYRLFDGGGLYLEVMPTGGKLWRLKYRFGDKVKRLSFGNYPKVTLSDARLKRAEARKILDNGADPGDEKKAKKVEAAKQATTFEVMGRAWFALKKPEWFDTHAVRILSRLERDLLPWLGSRPIAEISTPEILATLKRISDRGAKDTAKRAKQECSAIFAHAMVKGVVLSNPVDPIRGHDLPNATKDHFAGLTDPAQVAGLLRALDAFNGTFVVRSALLLSPYVFVRPGELRQAKWADIDLDRAEWEFTISKQKKIAVKRTLLVPLSSQSVAILRELHALTGRSAFVFPGARDHDRAMSDAAVNAALRRMGYDTRTEITGHGFRAMARTILHEQLGIEPAVIEHQLSHKVPDALGDAYNRTKFIDQRRAMMQRWADYLDELRKGAKIIPFVAA